MLRLVPLILALVLTPVLAACGGEDQGDPDLDDPAAAGVAFVDLSEAQEFLERGRIALARQALGEPRAPIAQEVEPRPAESRRLASQTRREFALLVFESPAQAREAWPSVLETDNVEEGGAAMRAANLIAVFPEPADDGFYGRVKRRLRALAIACRGGSAGSAGQAAREACDTAAGGPVPPPGEGAATEELAPIGATVDVGGIQYRVTASRQLNSRIEPDRVLVDGLRVPQGRLLFGVFLRACNERGEATRTTDRLALVRAFGERTKPVDLPADNPFAYEPARLEVDECLPAEGSAADRTADGVLVLFELSTDQLEERPFGLEIVARDGSERATIQLDV